ncbi:hypothetical protein [Natronobacterium texcoconense]|uniref:Uncharacterized protein n=1 Tax=Natronobacterium texcoconense TaxID=1095778 RepID=A0A1H1IS78_NATTX|nr:hypothetical protein [Natronobacterium texcoconense]SDR40489.1 hypothetical protein SAMN04489842_3773 [Natronobacterium texcoconense]
MRNRCEMGTLLAEDYAAYIDQHEIEPGSFADVRRGAWPEFIGDLRTIAGCDDADEAYQRAKTIYERCDEWEFVMAEEEHMRLAAFFRSVRRGTGGEIPRDAPERLPLEGPTFAEWLEYKRERLPALLEELEEQGEWLTE